MVDSTLALTADSMVIPRVRMQLLALNSKMIVLPFVSTIRKLQGRANKKVEAPSGNFCDDYTKNFIEKDSLALQLNFTFSL